MWKTFDGILPWIGYFFIISGYLWIFIVHIFMTYCFDQKCPHFLSKMSANYFHRFASFLMSDKNVVVGVLYPIYYKQVYATEIWKFETKVGQLIYKSILLYKSKKVLVKYNTETRAKRFHHYSNIVQIFLELLGTLEQNEDISTYTTPSYTFGFSTKPIKNSLNPSSTSEITLALQVFRLIKVY